MRYTTIRPKKFWRRDARGNLTFGQLHRLGISSASASPCSMLIQHRFAFLNLRPSLRIDESQEELSIPRARDLKTNNCFPLLATGGPPGVIQRRGVGRRKGEMHKDGPPGRLPLPGNPGISRFMPFICVHLCHLWITFSCLGFFSSFSCGSWLRCIFWLRLCRAKFFMVKLSFFLSCISCPSLLNLLVAAMPR